MEINKEKPILVTGATGYVAGRIVEKLLREGMTVHAAVRNPNQEEKLRYLNQLADQLPGKIKYFKTDLLIEKSYEEAMKNCELVYHTASPFFLNVKDNQRDFIDPAVKGTKNILDTANKTASVKRIVLTSSCAAIYGDAIDLKSTKNGIFTEEDWNTTSSPTHHPYFYSKVTAEKKAWEIARTQSQWDLIVINPSLVIGPSINPNATSGSFEIIQQIGNGKMKMGAPALNLGAVDVRDLADAHFKAGFTPSAKGRHIVSAENTSLLELANHLQPNYGIKYPLPKKLLPYWLIWLLGPLSGMSRKEIARNIGQPWKADNSKGKKELNLHYRPVSESISEMFQQLIDSKQI